MIATKDFKFSPDGITVVEIRAGDEIPPGRAEHIAKVIGATKKKRPVESKAMSPNKNK